MIFSKVCSIILNKFYVKVTLDADFFFATGGELGIEIIVLIFELD